MIKRRDLVKRLSRSTTIALLLSPAGLLLISAVRLVIVADYNPATALAILSSGGYVNTLLGTIMPLVPIFIPYIALVLMFFERAIVGILALLVTVLISPVSSQGSAALATIKMDLKTSGDFHNSAQVTLLMPLVVLFILLIVLGLGSDVFNKLLKVIGVISALALVPVIWFLYPLSIHDGIYSDLVRQPWLPAERITLANHQKVIVFTLSNDGDWSEVLIAGSRDVKWYPASEITERVLCQVQQDPRTDPLIPLVQSQTNVPSCMPTKRNQIFSQLPPSTGFSLVPKLGEVPVKYLFPQDIRHSSGS
jgi:hypothetical protein